MSIEPSHRIPHETAPPVLPAPQALDEGLVYLINQAILWPRGLALACATPRDGGTPYLCILNFGEPITDGEANSDVTRTRIVALNNADRARYALFPNEAETENPDSRQ